VYRDDARWLATVNESSDELCRLASEIAQASPGRAYLLRKRRERLRAAAADRLAAEALAAIFGRLESLSAAARRNAVGAAAPGPTRLMLSAALLVDATAADAFRAIAAELARAYEPQGVSVQLTGPWAPYSFVGQDYGAA